jgi:AcrR family transcriptional regulator
MLVRMTAEQRPRGLREITRQTVQAQIAEKAMALFVEHGFDETTIEQIASAVGISSRSVSRYFPTKEDMVVGNLLQVGRDVAAALAARPADEDPWVALRHALRVSVQSILSSGTGAQAAAMMAKTPALRAALVRKHAYWHELLVPDISARLGDDADAGQVRAHAIVAAALAFLDVAVIAWTQGDATESLDDLLDTAFTAVRG